MGEFSAPSICCKVVLSRLFVFLCWHTTNIVRPDCNIVMSDSAIVWQRGTFMTTFAHELQSCTYFNYQSLQSAEGNLVLCVLMFNTYCAVKSSMFSWPLCNLHLKRDQNPCYYDNATVIAFITFQLSCLQQCCLHQISDKFNIDLCAIILTFETRSWSNCLFNSIASHIQCLCCQMYDHGSDIVYVTLSLNGGGGQLEI